MRWCDGFAAYLRTYEVRLHVRTKTFGGKTWPDTTPGLIGPAEQIQIAVRAAERRAS